MEHYHDNDNFGMGHTEVSMIVPFPTFTRRHKSSSTEHGVKNFAKFISHYEYFSNSVLGEHSDKSICL